MIKTVNLNITKDNRQRFIILSVIAILFAAIQLVSTYIFHYISFQYSPISVSIFNLLLLITFFLLFFVLGGGIYCVIDHCASYKNTNDNRNNHKKGLAYFLLIILGWSPWLYAYYPGSLNYDMCVEYDHYYGSSPLTIQPPFRGI